MMTVWQKKALMKRTGNQIQQPTWLKNVMRREDYLILLLSLLELFQNNFDNSRFYFWFYILIFNKKFVRMLRVTKKISWVDQIYMYKCFFDKYVVDEGFYAYFHQFNGS